MVKNEDYICFSISLQCTHESRFLFGIRALNFARSIPISRRRIREKWDLSDEESKSSPNVFKTTKWISDWITADNERYQSELRIGWVGVGFNAQ